MRKAFILLWFFCALTSYAQTGTEQEAYNSGVKYYNTNKFDMAIADFARAIRLNSNNASYYLWRGAAYIRKSEYNFGESELDTAIADLNQAIRLNPNVAGHYYWRGRAYSQRWKAFIYRKDYAGIYPNDIADQAQAVADFEAALRLDPNNTDTRSRLEDARRYAVSGPPLPPPMPDLPPDPYPDLGPPPLPPGEW
jgi:tetratricopeptide (TPR) repeat protein